MYRYNSVLLLHCYAHAPSVSLQIVIWSILLITVFFTVSTMADVLPPHKAALEAQFEYMVDSIDARLLAPACLAAGLISDRQRDECFHESSAFKKAELLLSHVKRSIKGDRTKFDTFVAILGRTEHSRQADKLSECRPIIIIAMIIVIFISSTTHVQ